MLSLLRVGPATMAVQESMQAIASHSAASLQRQMPRTMHSAALSHTRVPANEGPGFAPASHDLHGLLGRPRLAWPTDRWEMLLNGSSDAL
eukprot:3892058-Alexandrium_andersonii.AAC.1